MNGDQVLLRDEILEVMFWMRGEGIAAEPPPSQLRRFLNLSAEELDGALLSLMAADLVTVKTIPEAGTAYELTGAGIEEAKRRFHEAFADYFGKESHLECSEPGCDCHSPDFVGNCKYIDAVPN
jgi:hypothetical protein